MFGNGVAMRLAQQADDKVNAANAMLAAAIAEFKAHTEACNNNTKQLREEMLREHNGQQEWRKGLGERLDSQDRMMWRVALLVIGVLCSVIVTAGGFLLPHLVTFK
jgi:hypothetical protein